MKAYPNDHGCCPRCGKRSYPSRAAAKMAAKRKFPGEHLTPYACGREWHFGHLPQAAAVGILSRNEVYGR